MKYLLTVLLLTLCSDAYGKWCDPSQMSEYVEAIYEYTGRSNYYRLHSATGNNTPHADCFNVRVRGGRGGWGTSVELKRGYDFDAPLDFWMSSEWTSLGRKWVDTTITQNLFFVYDHQLPEGNSIKQLHVASLYAIREGGERPQHVTIKFLKGRPYNYQDLWALMNELEERRKAVPPPCNASADLNGDGVVDFADFLLFAQAFQGDM